MDEGSRPGRVPPIAVATLAGLAIAAALTLAACSSQGQEGPEVSSDEAAHAVPEPLQTIEAQAEDIIDVAPAGDWTTIATDVEDISAAWKAYLASDAGASAPTVSSEALTKALAALETASAA